MARRVVVVSSIDPSPLFLTTLPYISWLDSRGVDFSVVLVPPVYPIWEWRGLRDLGLEDSGLVFIGDLVTPETLRRLEPLILMAKGAVAVTGAWCAGLLSRRVRMEDLQVYEYREFAGAYGIRQPPDDVAETVSREASRLFTVNRFLFARVLGGPLASEWARRAAGSLMSEGASWLKSYINEHLADAVNTVEDIVDRAECSDAPWGHYAEVTLDNLVDHALLAPAAARAARRSRKAVLIVARGDTPWHTAALYDGDAQRRRSRLAHTLERAAASKGGYATCGRYTVEVTARPDVMDRILAAFMEEAGAPAVYQQGD